MYVPAPGSEKGTAGLRLGADTRCGVAGCSGSPQRHGPYCDGSGLWLSPFVCTLAWRTAGLADLSPAYERHCRRDSFAKSVWRSSPVFSIKTWEYAVCFLRALIPFSSATTTTRSPKFVPTVFNYPSVRCRSVTAKIGSEKQTASPGNDAPEAV